MKKHNIYQDIYAIGRLYRKSKSEGIKESYDEHIQFIILEEPEHMRKGLEKIWEVEKEGLK